MAASMDRDLNVKLSKSDRKLRKKLIKSQSTLLKHDGIKASETPTSILCVNNAGLGSSVSRDEVFQVFQGFGAVEDIIMVPEKPYAFVCYDSEKAAESAYNTLNGQKFPDADQRQWPITLYISYVSQVPASLAPSQEIPPGLILLEDYITQDYASKLLHSINWEEPTSTDMQRELKHRQVKHYGYEFKYGINDVDADSPLPQSVPTICQELLDKAVKAGYIQSTPDQVTINRYLPGQGIPPHVDTPAAFEDGIMSLSLGSQVLMEFRHPDGKHLSVLLPPRSLLIMTGESRYLWSHGITPRKSDIISTQDGRLTIVHRGIRTSFTFRKIIHPKDRIHRPIPFLTEQRTSTQTNVPESTADAAKLEETHVHKVYEEIADHFSGTRHSPWPRIADFIREQPVGTVLADIGCGNGKYLGINKSIFGVGSDRSTSLARICESRDFPVFVSDVLSIPIRTGFCDVCLCIAVLHHLSTEERRLHGLAELVRILRPGGKALIYVWAMEQELHKVKSKYLKEVKITPIETSEPGDVAQGIEEVSVKDTSENVEESVSELSETNTDKCNTELQNCSPSTCDKPEENSRDNTASKCNTELQNCSPSTCDKPEEDSRDNTASKAENCEVCGGESQQLKSGDRVISKGSQSQHASQVLEIHKNRTSFKQQDMLVPWQLKKKNNICANTNDDEKFKTGEQVFHRYYHVFKQGELEALCGKLDNCQVLNGYYDQGNWAVVLQKK